MLLDRIRQHQIWRVGRVGRFAGHVPEMAPGGFQSVDRAEGDEHPVTEIAFERARFMRGPEAFEQSSILDEREQPKRPALARKLARHALVHVDFGPRRDLDRDHARVGGITEQQTVAVKLRRNFLVSRHRGPRPSIVHPHCPIRQRVARGFRTYRGSRGRSERSRMPLRRPSASEFRVPSRAG